MKSFALSIAIFTLLGCGSLRHHDLVDTTKFNQQITEADNARHEKERQDFQKTMYDRAIKDAEFERLNPEVPIEKLPLTPDEKISQALNGMGFMTRFPKENDPSKVYAKIGGYKLGFNQFISALRMQVDDCKRISAYSDHNLEKECKKLVVSDVLSFTKMKNDPLIPDLTKKTALSEASFRGYIDFNHAAKLAKMHKKLCNQQSNKGYVAMVTVAVPCSGQGDVLNVDVAERVGLIN